MVNLVQVPWQPEYYLTPDTLAYLVAASQRLGTQLRLTDGWRSWESQHEMRVYYEADPVNHPYAGDPDNPDDPRNHMRGGAFDLVRTDPAAQAACRAVGLSRDASESWHWNNPNAKNMPIIRSLADTSVTGTATTVTPQGEEDEMTPDERDLLNRAVTASENNAWTLGQIKPIIDELSQGKGAVHTKLDQLLFVTNDAQKGIRQIVSAIGAAVAKIVTKLGA